MFTKKSSCYMNLMQYHEDSLKESLKTTMLNQENLFRNQVLELHRLYQMQMILMKNLRLKEVPTTQSLNYFKQDCKVDWARYDQRPLDLAVPVSSYVSNFDRHVLNKGNSWGSRENPVEVEDYFHVETETSLEEAAKLSLSIGRETLQRMSSWRSQNEEVRVLPGTSEVEESIGTVFSRDVVELKPALCCGVCSADTGQRNGSRASCNCTNSTDKYLSNRARKFQSHGDESENIHGNSFNLGNKKSLENHPETKSTMGEVFPSHGGICLDLNAHPDESFSDSKHPRESFGSWTKPNENCSSQVSALLQLDTPSSVLINCERTDSMNPPSGSKPCSIDLESYPLSPSNSSEDYDCKCEMDKPIQQDVPIRTCKEENVTEVIVEKSEEVFEDVATDERSPELSKSDHITEDPSSSLKTMQSGTYLEKSFSRMNSFQNSDSSQVDSFAIGESKADRSCDEDIGGSGRDDPVIQKGAVSFIYFLLEARREQDSVSKADQPECSIDSFASTVLKMPNCNTDDYCVSSNPYEIIETEKKDSGIKLRRGRRLKDFQKEILPSLPSLSRQEICEDIRIMEGAIRSREYKRYRSKVSNEQSWFTPVRSRRSRLNYIGRRCYK